MRPVLAALLVAALLAQDPQPVPAAGPQRFPVAEVVELRGPWRFARGDSAMWARPGWPDGAWLLVAVPGRWPDEGGTRYRGYAWYHLHYQLDSTATEPLAVRFSSVATATKLPDKRKSTDPTGRAISETSTPTRIVASRKPSGNDPTVKSK